MYGTGKEAALTKVGTDTLFHEEAKDFNHPGATKDVILVVGEKSLLCLYNCRPDEGLGFAKFCQKVGTRTTFVKPESRPPTSVAAAYHSLRVFYVDRPRTHDSENNLFCCSLFDHKP